MNSYELYKHAKNRTWELGREADRQRLLGQVQSLQSPLAQGLPSVTPESVDQIPPAPLNKGRMDKPRRFTETEQSDGEGIWNKNFLLYWLGIAASALGDAFIFVALPFLVLELSDSPTALATTVLLGSLPRFLGPLIGTLADRLHLRLPLALAGLLRTVLFASLGMLALDGQLSLGVVYLAAPLNGLITIFVFAAGNVLVPQLVPRETLGRANSLMQAAIMGVPLLGLGVAGALVATVGTGLTLALASPLFAVLALAVMVITFPTVVRAEKPVNVLSDIVRGASFLLRSGPLAFLLVSSLALNAILSMLNVTMPVVMDRLGRGATGYGLFETALSVGMLVGILTVSALAGKIKPPFQISLSQACITLGFVTLSLAGYHLYLLGGAILGFSLGMSEVAAITLLQLMVPDGMRGKVIGVVLSVNAFGLTGGAYLAGRLVSNVSVSLIYAVSAVIALLMCLLWTYLNLRQPLKLEPALT